MENSSIPISTQWLRGAVSESDRLSIESVYLLASPSLQRKGTAFLLSSGLMITNHHVVEGADCSQLLAISSSGRPVRFKAMATDQTRDLAALVPTTPLAGGLQIDSQPSIRVGTQVATWGFPLGYNGPAPLLSVGYLSGFNDNPPYEETPHRVKHLVVNGAFNPGNSGGPLLLFGNQSVVGVVVNKHAPISRFIASAIDVLGQTKSGVVFKCTDGAGQTRDMVEAQVVAEVLKYFRGLTQVMIGEAVASSELVAFLEEKGFPYEAACEEDTP